MAYFTPFIDASGIHLPTYEDRLQDLCGAYRSIFGQEAELNPAVPDYQLLSVFAKALDDTSALVLQAYNSRNPLYAAGQALDLLLPQYGIVRNPGETDAEVRKRMSLAAASRGVFSLDAMEAALREISGVTHVMIRENGEDAAVDGVPAHTVAVYISGGNIGLIADTVWRKKPPGIGTSGTLSRNVIDEKGNVHTVKISRPPLEAVSFRIEVTGYEGFDADEVTARLRSRLFSYVNYELDIGEAINVPQLYGMLYQAAGDYASSFSVTDMTCSGNHGVSREKVDIAWNAKFTMVSSTEVTVVVNS